MASSTGGIDVLRQRQLHEDAVHLRVRVQPVDDAEQLVLGRVLRQRDLARRRTRLVGRLALHADVHLAGGVLPDEHDGEPRHAGCLANDAPPPRSPRASTSLSSCPLMIFAMYVGAMDVVRAQRAKSMARVSRITIDLDLTRVLQLVLEPRAICSLSSDIEPS
jgi:hypothetical protein